VENDWLTADKVLAFSLEKAFVRFLFDPPRNVGGRIFDPDLFQFSSAQKLHGCAIYERDVAEIKCDFASLVTIL
jgi:hypothetical protein